LCCYRDAIKSVKIIYTDRCTIAFDGVRSRAWHTSAWQQQRTSRPVSGFLVGIIENLACTYIPGVRNELKLPIALALIISVLVVKPAGLFGRAIVKRV
jgi:hypothetical protein